MSLVCSVVSFVPFDIREEKPGLIPPSFFIKASDMKVPTILKVETATHFVYLDEARKMLQVKDPPDVVARAIVEDYCNSQLGIADDAGPALFWLDTDISEEEVLEKHKIMVIRMIQRQKRWFMNITKMADDDWRKYHQHTVISDFQRRLGEILGLDSRDHEWMSPLTLLQETTKKCQFCASNVEKEAVVCPVCGNTIDAKKKHELELAQKG